MGNRRPPENPRGTPDTAPGNHGPQEAREEGNRVAARWGLPGILLLALLLRLPGHFHPVAFHYDETMEIDQVVNTFPPGGSLRHPFLSRYLVFAAQGVHFLTGRIAGDYRSTSDFGRWLEADPSRFLYAGRSVSLVAGLVTILVTYALGRRIWSAPVGLGGALLLAVAPGHILVSNNLRMWSLGTCLAALALFLAVRIGTIRRRRAVFSAGLAAGFAIASVYSLGLLLLPLALALWIRSRSGTGSSSASVLLRDSISLIGGVVAGLLVGNVGGFLRGADVVAALAQVAGRDSSGSLASYVTNAGWYVSSLWDVYGLGPPLTVLAAAGVCTITWWSRSGSWVLACFLLCVFAVQPAILYLWAGRYVVPAYPLLVLAATTALAGATKALRRLSPRFARVPIFAGVLSLLVVINLSTVVPYAIATRRTPTRELARLWIEENIPDGAKIVLNVEYVSPALQGIGGRPGEEAPVDPSRPSYGLAYLPLPTQSTLEGNEAALEDTVASLARAGFAYLVCTDPIPPLERARLGEENYEKRVLDREYPLVRRFLYSDLTKLPDDTALLNPEVRIYRLHDGLDREPREN